MHSQEENQKIKYIDRYTQKVLMILIKENGLNLKEATELLKDSPYFELMEEDDSYVMHYSPKYWAEKALLFQRELMSLSY
jgi:hypothetical protein